jgi:hypothetical protein
MLARGAILTVSTLFSIYQSGFNRIANFISSIWNDISQTLISGMETVINNIVGGLNAVIQQVNQAIEFANQNVTGFNRDQFAEIGAVDINSEAAQLNEDRTTDVAKLQRENSKQIQELTNALEGGLSLELEGEIETDEGHIVRLVDGQLKQEAQRSKRLGSRD